MRRWCIAVLIAPCVSWAGSPEGGDWPEWGGDASRNMVSSETRLPNSFSPGHLVEGTDQVDMASTSGVRWVAKLGSQTYGNPTVANGRVYVGTNNQMERRPGVTGDYSVVLAFDEVTGEPIWQHSVPKLGAGKVNDWEYLGVCSSPAVHQEVVYVVTNRCEVVALDVHGLSNGNDEFADEAQYIAGPNMPPVELSDFDADILWRFDMREELGVFPHNVASSSVLVMGDKLYVTTSNGTDWSHLNVPSPFAPALVVLDRATGKLIGEEVSGVSAATMHSNWSSPAAVPATKDRDALVLFGAGDGYLYGFEPDPIEIDGLPALKEVWRFDGNDPGYRADDAGKPVKYATYKGPSEFIGTPVYADGIVYAAIGQDPEHGPGVGRLSAVNPFAGEGDVSKTAALWTYDDLTRTVSTVAVHEGLVYAADYDGRLHCVDAETGQPYWVHDTGAHIWGSPLVADGKVYLGNEDGVLTVLRADSEKTVLSEIEFPAPLHATPVAANGSLYIATMTHLYAVGPMPGKGKKKPRKKGKNK